MSRVFSKRRIESIKNLEVKKYLLYSVGEVLIVTIGIFLAIYLNGLKEENANRKYVSSVLKDADDEARKYIRNSVIAMNYNAERDTLVHKILTNTVKREDYSLRGNSHLDVLNSILDLSFDNKPLENLNQRIDFLSEDEKKVYDRLSLIKTSQGTYESVSENAVEILNDYKKFQKENHEWYYLYGEDSIATQREFDYRLNSFEYKNFLNDYANYEIGIKSISYTYFQLTSIGVILSIAKAKDEEELTSEEIDALLASLNFNKFPSIACESVDTAQADKYILFEDAELYNFAYNASNDTILVKNEEGRILRKIDPKRGVSILASNGSDLQVFIDEECVARYRTQINSFLFYE